MQVERSAVLIKTFGNGFYSLFLLFSNDDFFAVNLFIVEEYSVGIYTGVSCFTSFNNVE